MQKLLIIGYTWPESKTTGAGMRMMQLIDFFLNQSFEITFASAAEKSKYSEYLKVLGISESPIKLNDAGFDDFLKNLNPSIVLFDRFYTEEQFGWRVAEVCPNAMRILDTEDLHFLRKSREQEIKQGEEVPLMLSEVAKRELASIYRCDLTLIISEAEMKMLTDKFRIDKSLLCYLPFLQEWASPVKETLPSFEDRRHFIFIGNFKHQPNVDAVLELKKTIWPLIAKKLPEAELHIYGAYASDQIIQLHKPRERFFLKGWVEDVETKMKNAKVMLAPLRFGAGLKVKLIQSMHSGTPSITTQIGAEGINGEMPWNGFVEEDPELFSAKGIALYLKKSEWEESQKNGFLILENRFDQLSFIVSLIDRIQSTFSSLDKHRQNNFIGSLLLHHTLQSTKYMSKWIEEKNKPKN